MQARSVKGNAGPCAVRLCPLVGVAGAAKSAFPFFQAADGILPEAQIQEICRYDCLPELADDLNVMALAVDRCLIDLEHRLPDYYEYPGDMQPQKD